MSKSKITAIFATILLSVAIAGCGSAKKPETNKSETPETNASASQSSKDGKVVAQIGSEKITLEEIDGLVKTIPEQYQAMAREHKDMFLDSVINQKLLYAEAARLNFDKNTDVQKQLEEIRKELVIKAYLKEEIEDKITVTDEDIKKYYEANKEKFKEPEKVKVSHILVDTEAEAKDILAKLQSGADFAALAKEKSKCPSKEKGGELGFISKGQTVPEFEQAVFVLQPGQLSGVVKTQFGYHIIKVTEKQPEKIMALDEVKDQLKQMLLADKQKARFESLLKDLKDKNKVVVYKDVLMPPSANTESKSEQPQSSAPKADEPGVVQPTGTPATESVPVEAVPAR